MTYDVSWIIENHVLYIHYQGEVSLGDIRQSTRDVVDWVEAVYEQNPENTVIGVVDLTEANLNQILWTTTLNIIVKQVKDVIDPRITRLKTGFVALITDSERARIVISLLLRLFSQPLTTVASLDEALAIIDSMYPELAEQLEHYRENHISAGTS
jgi:hypothetical protein